MAITYISNLPQIYCLTLHKFPCLQLLAHLSTWELFFELQSEYPRCFNAGLLYVGAHLSMHNQSYLDECIHVFLKMRMGQFIFPPALFSIKRAIHGIVIYRCTQ